MCTTFYPSTAFISVVLIKLPKQKRFLDQKAEKTYSLRANRRGFMKQLAFFFKMSRP